MANGVYNKGKYLISTAALDLATADLRLMLVSTGYTFSAAHNWVSETSPNEISTSGYARSAIDNKTVTEDDTNNFAFLNADDEVFTSLATGVTIAGAILFVQNASDTGAALLSFYDLTDTPTNGGNVTVQWASSSDGGVLKLS